MVKDIITSVINDNGPVFVNQVANGVINDNMTEQDSIVFFKIGVKRYPVIFNIESVGQYLNKSKKI